MAKYRNTDDDNYNSEEKFSRHNSKKAKKPPRHLTVKQLYTANHAHADHHNSTFIDAGLEHLYREEFFSEVVWELRSGKEATVYVLEPTTRTQPMCPSGYLVAKLYVDSSVRSFRNTKTYTQGRFINDSRRERAKTQQKDIGTKIADNLWVGEEYHQLHVLHKAGFAVPQPIAHAGNCILMQFIGEQDQPAPRVAEAGLDLEEATQAAKQAIDAMGRLLGLGKVHGDFSTFNMLWHQDKICLIDFPQMVQWQQNRKAKSILERDVQGLVSTFSPLGVKLNAQHVLEEVWEIAKLHGALDFIDE